MSSFKDSNTFAVLDLSSKFLVPVALAVLGYWVTSNQSKEAVITRQDEANIQQKLAEERTEADRKFQMVKTLFDSVPRLASGNKAERLYMIQSLNKYAEEKNEFPKTLLPAVTFMANHDADPDVKKAASDILVTYATANLEAPDNSASAPAQTTTQADVQKTLKAIKNLDLGTEAQPLIYIQVQKDSADQLASAKDIMKKLNGWNNCVAPGIERIDIVPKTTELRFFNAEDKPLADKIAAQITFWGVPVKAIPAGGKAKRGQFELWYGKN